MKILFICLGNICRSPMAEYIMRHKLKQAGLAEKIMVESAGTAGYHDGDEMHPDTAGKLKAQGIDPQGFISSKVKKGDIDEFDLLIAMDHQNVRDLEKKFGPHPNRIFKITDLVPDIDFDHIPDPWYNGDFEGTFQLLDKCCDALLRKLQSEFGADNLA